MTEGIFRRMRSSSLLSLTLGALTMLCSAGCANNSASANNANAAQSSVAPSATPMGMTQTGAAEQNAVAGQTNASNLTTNNVATGQPASAGGASTAGAAKVDDACALLTSDDIKAVQGEAVKESKPSRRDDATLRVSECFYTTETFNKSISLELTTGADGQSARRLWDERFARAREEAGKGEREREREKREREREREKKKAEPRGEEEEEEGAPPAAVKGLGDEAYWAPGRVNGTLYARKGDAFVRVSIGGAETDAARMSKAKVLARRALARL